MRVGYHWRALAADFGNWNAVYKRFNPCSKNKLISIFKYQCNVEWECIKGVSVNAYQHSAGVKGKDDQAIGLSRGGNNSKIHFAIDSYDLLIAFEIIGVHDKKALPILIHQLRLSAATVGNKGYASQAIRENIQERGSVIVIPRRKNSKLRNADLDVDLYKLRYLVENAFARLKQF